LLVPDVLNPFFPEIIKAVEDIAKGHRYNVFLGNAESNYDTLNWYIDTFIERGVDGVVFTGILGGAKDRECFEKLVSAKIPCIMIDRYINSTGIPFVGSNNFMGGYKAAKHLIEIGHKRIATITGPLNIELNIERLAGFKKALREFNIRLDDSLIFESDFTAFGGYHCMEKILNLSEPPTAVFVMSDAMAIGALAVLKNKMVAIPDEMAIVGFDDISVVSLLSTPLTTIAQRKYDMGAKAVNVLIESIGKKILPDIQLILDVDLVVRNSTVKDVNKDIMLTKYGYFVNRTPSLPQG
jgi:DNA-binding LacI/PurR family transcriptional regulator